MTLTEHFTDEDRQFTNGFGRWFNISTTTYNQDWIQTNGHPTPCMRISLKLATSIAVIIPAPSAVKLPGGQVTVEGYAEWSLTVDPGVPTQWRFRLFPASGPSVDSPWKSLLYGQPWSRHEFSTEVDGEQTLRVEVAREDGNALPVGAGVFFDDFSYKVFTSPSLNFPRKSYPMAGWKR